MCDSGKRRDLVALRAFNNLFFEFLDDMMTVLPLDANMAICRKAFETVKQMNATTIVLNWNLSVYGRYKTQIDEGDVSFFLKKDYRGDISSLSNVGEVEGHIERLRFLLRDIGEQNMEKCAKYLKSLSQLSEVYVNAKRG